MSSGTDSLVAMRFGVRVESVTLYPIGGIARMSSIPEKPSQELLVSLAGPLVNVVIVLFLSLIRGGFPSWGGMDRFPATPGELVDALIRANVILAVFNLLPAFPMDGGRIIRSILAMFLPYTRATALAALLGQLIAVGFILLGFRLNPFLILIGFFVFFGAEAEERAVRVRKLLSRISVGDVMLTDFAVLSPDDTVARCLELTHHHRQENFPVVLEGKIVGVLARADWLRALSRQGSSTPVQGIMKRNFISVDARTPLSRIYRDLRQLDQTLFPVMRDGRMVGLLTSFRIPYRPGRLTHETGNREFGEAERHDFQHGFPTACRKLFEATFQFQGLWAHLCSVDPCR